jgi:hypothetical protein
MGALRSLPVVLMTLAYLLIGFGVYANVFFLPLMIKDLRFINLITSYLAALPAALGVLGMVLVSRSSDRTGERVWHVAVCTLVAGGPGARRRLHRQPDRRTWQPLCGRVCNQRRLAHILEPADGIFRSGDGGGRIATINSIGNISGYAAPQLVGIRRDATGTCSLALVVVGVMGLVAAALLLFAGAPARAAQLRRAPA